MYKILDETHPMVTASKWRFGLGWTANLLKYGLGCRDIRYLHEKTQNAFGSRDEDEFNNIVED